MISAALLSITTNILRVAIWETNSTLQSICCTTKGTRNGCYYGTWVGWWYGQESISMATNECTFLSVTLPYWGILYCVHPSSHPIQVLWIETRNACLSEFCFHARSPALEYKLQLHESIWMWTEKAINCNPCAVWVHVLLLVIDCTSGNAPLNAWNIFTKNWYDMRLLPENVPKCIWILILCAVWDECIIIKWIHWRSGIFLNNSTNIFSQLIKLLMFCFFLQKKSWKLQIVININ